MKAFFYTAGELRAAAVQARFNEKDTAELLDVSVRQLERIVKRIFGITPEKFLARERLRIAPAVLLREGAVKRAAFALGFKQASHFSRAFKEKYGLSPSEFLARRRRDAILRELRKRRRRKGE